MKYRYLIIALMVAQHCLAQTTPDKSITNKNYYDHFQDLPGNSINWLRASDAVPVLIDELLKNGIQYYTIGVGQLIKIDDSTRLVVTVSFKKGDREYGFLYEATHGIPLDKRDRDFLSDGKPSAYVQAERSIKNATEFMRIEPLPVNVFLLKQRCYWYQFDNKATKYDVSKEVAQSILRQDIDACLKKL